MSSEVPKSDMPGIAELRTEEEDVKRNESISRDHDEAIRQRDRFIGKELYGLMGLEVANLQILRDIGGSDEDAEVKEQLEKVSELAQRLRHAETRAEEVDSGKKFLPLMAELLGLSRNEGYIGSNIDVWAAAGHKLGEEGFGDFASFIEKKYYESKKLLGKDGNGNESVQYFLPGSRVALSIKRKPDGALIDIKIFFSR